MIRMQPVNVYQPQAQSLAPQIAGLGDAFFGGMESAQRRALMQQEMDLKRRREEGLRALADTMRGGNIDYNAAAAGLIGSGDLQSGLGLLQLGEKAKERQAGEAALRSSPFTTLGQTAPQGGGMERAANAIAGIESGGRYDAVGPVTRTGDRAYGKYQVMGANIPAWTRQYLGREMTPQEFISSPEAQEAVFNGEFGRLKQKHGPDGAARAWFAGEGGMNDPNRRDVLGTSVADYSRKFSGAYGQPQQVAQAGAPMQAPLLSQTQPTLPPNDPAPQVNDQQLLSVLANPRLQQQHAIAKTVLDNRMKWRSENSVEAIEGRRLQNEKLRREIGRDESYRPMTPDERARFGIPADDKRPFAINNATGKPEVIGGSGVTVNNNQEKAFDSKTGGSIAERFAKMVEDGDQATTDMQTLGDLKALGQKVQTGGGAAVQGWLAERGIKIGPNVGAVEAYGAMIDRLTPQQRVPGSGATSDFDAKMFKASLPRLINSPEGNALIVGTMERLAENRIKRAEIAQQVQIGDIPLKDGLNRLRALQQEARQLSINAANPKSGAASQAAMPAPPQAVEYLKANPQFRDAFDQKYGAGAAARALGGR